MSIRTIIFDFGNVLSFFDRNKAARQLAAFAPPSVTSEQIAAFLYENDLEYRFEVDEVSALEMLDLIRETFDLKGTDAELALAYADMFTPNDDVCRLIPRLRGPYRLLLLSNTNDLHYRQFRRQFADTLDCFDQLVLSHEVKMRKPDPRLFAHVQDHTLGDPSQCVFIDDLQANIEAGRAHGWHTIQYQSGEDLADRLHQTGVTLSA